MLVPKGFKFGEHNFYMRIYATFRWKHRMDDDACSPELPATRFAAPLLDLFDFCC